MARYYTVPPATGFPGYSTSTSTSPAPEEYDYYQPYPYARGAAPVAGRGKRHHVRTTSYTPPRTSVWQGVTPGAGAPQYFTASPQHVSPVTKSTRHASPATHASARHASPATKGGRAASPSPKPVSSRPRRASTSRGVDVVEIGPDGIGRTRRNSVRLPTRHIVVEPESENDWDWDQPIYVTGRPRSSKGAPANRMRAQVDEVETPVRSRARRASTTTRPAPAPLPTKKARDPAPATAADAARHRIPAGYGLKNWDPAERPILLLGSVFDANSLGKWIYDWTVFTHRAGSPLAEMAGELWLMLIKFSHKMKRAEEGAGRVRGRDARQMVADFQEGGERLWRRLVNLLKVCEDFMWRVAKRQAGKASMGEKSGVEFVKTIFGRDRELEETEKLMSSVRLWLMRFDANCEDLLRAKKH